MQSTMLPPRHWLEHLPSTSITEGSHINDLSAGTMFAIVAYCLGETNTPPQLLV